MGRSSLLRWVIVAIGLGLIVLPEAWSGPVLFTLGRMAFTLADVAGLLLIVIWNTLYVAFLMRLLKQPPKRPGPQG